MRQRPEKIGRKVGRPIVIPDACPTAWWSLRVSFDWDRRAALHPWWPELPGVPRPQAEPTAAVEELSGVPRPQAVPDAAVGERRPRGGLRDGEALLPRQAVVPDGAAPASPVVGRLDVAG